jgi:hypothetical protein
MGIGEEGSVEHHWFLPGAFIAQNNDGHGTYVTDTDDRIENPCVKI